MRARSAFHGSSATAATASSSWVRGDEVVRGGADDLGRGRGGSCRTGRRHAGRGHGDVLRSRRPSRTAAAVRPSTVNVTMPHRWVPRSWTVTPGTSARPFRRCVAAVADRGLDVVDAQVQRVPERRDQAETVGDVRLPQLEHPRVLRAARSGRASPTCRCAGRPASGAAVASTRAAHHQEARAPRAAQPLAAGAGDDVRVEAGQRRPGRPTGTRPASPAPRPRARPRPPARPGSPGRRWSGTCTSDTSRTRSSSIVAAARPTSTAPVPSDGTGSTVAPTSSARRSSGIGVARVLRLGAQDPVARGQRDRVERGQPRAGGAVGERDLVRLAAQRGRQHRVAGLQVLARAPRAAR